jgi:polyisoprenoid-binding protein YceI
MKHSKHLLVFIVLFTFFLAACGGSTATQQPEATKTAVESSNQDKGVMDSDVEDGSMEDNDSEHMDDDSDDMVEDKDEHMDDDSDEMTESDEDMSSAGTGGITLVIVPDESEARFFIDEILSGADKVVVGTTTAVEGTISADKDNPAAVKVSAVKVDMSTLSTDSSFRNRAIKDFILHTGDPVNQFATFEPTAYSGLPESVTIGEAFTFQITGNLTIHGVTQEETFEVSLTPVSETRIEGTATLSDITYADYGVQILRLPTQVASVEDTVTLELSFVAEVQ